MLAVALVLSLTGCFRNYYLGEEAPELTAKSVQGAWVHNGPHEVAATITLNPDGTFIAVDLPLIHEPSEKDIQSGAVKDDTQVDWSTLQHGAGSWRIAVKTDGAYPAVYLTYDTATSDSSLTPSGGTQDWRGGEYFLLSSLAVKESTHLFFTAGDPDAKYRFLFAKR